jgi:hypothetical protein
VRRCLGCGGGVPLPEVVRRGPAARYCSTSCRRRAEFRRRRAARLRALAALWREEGNDVRADALLAAAVAVEAPEGSLAASSEGELPGATAADFEPWT